MGLIPLIIYLFEYRSLDKNINLGSLSYLPGWQNQVIAPEFMAKLEIWWPFGAVWVQNKP